MGDRTLDYVALCVLIFVVLTLVYGIIYIHDIPYEIAKKKPSAPGCNPYGRMGESFSYAHDLAVSLIWATLYKPDDGWGIARSPGGEESAERSPEEIVDSLKTRVAELEAGKEVMRQEFSEKLDQMHSRVAELEEQIRKGGEVS